MEDEFSLIHPRSNLSKKINSNEIRTKSSRKLGKVVHHYRQDQALSDILSNKAIKHGLIPVFPSVKSKLLSRVTSTPKVPESEFLKSLFRDPRKQS
jgi:hypothetical protein